MNITELNTFLAVVETGSLVRASQRLNVTQSTVTARLNTLEAELGQTLINRNRSGATLTGAGERLRRHAQTISDLWRQARQDTRLPNRLSAVCNIACETDLWPGLGQRLFDRVLREHPDTALSVWQGSRADVRQWLDDGLSDLAFTYDAAHLPRQDQVELAGDDLILVACDDGQAGPGTPGYVHIEAGQEFARDHAITYSDVPRARIGFGTAASGMDHILAHGGSAYLPRRMAQANLESGHLTEVRSAPVFSRRIFATCNRSAAGQWPWIADYLNGLAG